MHKPVNQLQNRQNMSTRRIKHAKCAVPANRYYDNMSFDESCLNTNFSGHIKLWYRLWGHYIH